jgi:hypothetical protein
MAEETNEEGQKLELGDTQLNAAPSERTTTPQEVEGEEIGAVGPPHWQALVDLDKVLPCEVLPVNEEDWVKIVKITPVPVADKRLEPDYILETEDGRELRGRETHDPVLVRTLDTSAEKLR